MAEPTKPSDVDMAADLPGCLSGGALPGDLEAACVRALFAEQRCREFEVAIKEVRQLEQKMAEWGKGMEERLERIRKIMDREPWSSMDLSKVHGIAKGEE